MRNKRNWTRKGVFLVTVAIALYILALEASWLITCGIVKLITLCFGLTFKWSVATGVWLTLLALKSVSPVIVNKQEKRR